MRRHGEINALFNLKGWVERPQYRPEETDRAAGNVTTVPPFVKPGATAFVFEPA
jgi:hypothetical protein